RLGPARASMLLAWIVVVTGSTCATRAPESLRKPSATSSTTTAIGRFPLTGLPAADLLRVQRPALSIKVDNAPAALPQSGLNDADIVVEELVEGDLTRLFVTFQSRDSPMVG